MVNHRQGYVLAMTAEDTAKAKEELGEDPEQTTSHIETLRDSLASMKHLSAPQDDDFLLLFLRRAKFSQTKARELIDNFIKCRVTDPFKEMYVTSPSLDSQVLQCYEAGTAMIIPTLQGSGGRTVILRPSKIDLSVISFRDAARAAVALMEVALLDPVTQVHGVQCIGDDHEASMAYYGQLMSPTTLRITSNAFMNTMPCRVKGLHLVRGPLPAVASAAVTLLKTFISSKIGSRVHIHKSIASLQDAFEPAVLPNELGGTAGTYEDIIRKSYNHVMRNKEVFARYISINYDADKAGDDTVTGTFRKLAI